MRQEKTFVVYIAKNKVNGHRYIGATSCGLEIRRMKHFYDAKAERPGCRIFNIAIRKYGPGAFEWEILAEASSFELMMQKEVELIAELRPEYNMTRGGEGIVGMPRTEEWRKRISMGLRGRKLSPETIAAMSGRDMSFLFKPVVCLNDGLFFRSVKDAASHYKIGKKKISEMLSGRQITTGGLSFAYSSGPMGEVERNRCLKNLEERRKAWEARRNKDKARPVVCLVDGIEYESAIAAAKHFSISPSYVMLLCQKGGSTTNGLSFRYADSPAVTKRVRTEAEREIHRRAVLAGLQKAWIKQSKKVKCVETGAVYESIASAAKACNIDAKNLYAAIAHGRKSSGLTFVRVAP